MNDIQNALAVGKEVITHTNPISVPGWTGAGYIIFDPDTGEGAYRITGGGNGGWMFWGVIFFLSALITLSLVTGNLYAAALGLIAYNNFLEKVKWIGRQNFTPEQALTELNRAAAVAVTTALAGRVLSKLKLGARGEILRWLLLGWSWAFGSVWYSE